MSENGYPVSGLLNMLANKSLSIKQVEDAINQYIEISAKRGYAEGIVDGLRRDRPPQEDEKDAVSRSKSFDTQSHYGDKIEGLKHD